MSGNYKIRAAQRELFSKSLISVNVLDIFRTQSVTANFFPEEFLQHIYVQLLDRHLVEASRCVNVIVLLVLLHALAQSIVTVCREHVDASEVAVRLDGLQISAKQLEQKVGNLQGEWC